MIYFANAPVHFSFKPSFRSVTFFPPEFNSDTVSCIDLISGLVSDDPLEGDAYAFLHADFADVFSLASDNCSIC
jgi:hypothetical protein